MHKNIHLYIFILTIFGLFKATKSLKVENTEFSILDITNSVDDLVDLSNNQYSKGGICNKTSYIEIVKLTKVSLNETTNNFIKINETTYWLKVISTIPVGENQKYDLLFVSDNSMENKFQDFFTFTCKERPLNIQRELVGKSIYMDRHYNGRYGVLAHNGLDQYLSEPGSSNPLISNTFTQGYYDDSLLYTDVSKNYTIFKPVIQSSAFADVQISIETMFDSSSIFTKLNVIPFLNSTYFKTPVVSLLHNDNTCSSLRFDQCSLLYTVTADSQKPGFYFLMNNDSGINRPELVFGNLQNGYWLFTITNIAEYTPNFNYPIYTFDSLYGFNILTNRTISYIGQTGSNTLLYGQLYFGTQMQKTFYFTFSKVVLSTTVNYGDLYFENGFNTLFQCEYPFFISSITSSNVVNTFYIPASIYQKSFWKNGGFNLYLTRYPFPIPVDGDSGMTLLHDSIPPIFENIEYFDSASDNCIVRVTASDEGGSCIQSITISFVGAYSPSVVQSSYRITNRNLIQGDCFNGIYQISIPKYSIRRSYFIEIMDYGNNAVTLYPNNFYSGKRYLGSFPYKILKLEDIESISFSNNNINLSNNRSTSKMYIKLIDKSISNLVFQFIPKIGIDTYQANRKISGSPPFFTSKWDSSSQHYEISFDLPARLPTGPISYILNPIEIDSSIFYQYFGTSSELSVYSETADIMGPIVISFSPFGNTTIPSLNEQPNPCGFNLILNDYYNGIYQVNITVSSDKTYRPLFKSLTYPDLPLSKQVSISWELNYGDVPQTFSITKLSIMDGKGYVTEFPNPTKVNPFMLIMELYTSFSLTTIGEIQTDVTPPYLQVYHVNQLVIENYLERTLQINFTVYDAESGIYIDEPPVLYLINDNVEIISKPTTFISGINGSGGNFFETVVFGVNITLPFLFGYPNGILTQIHGIFDNKFNVLGATPDIINQYDRGDSFINVTVGQPQPFIESVNMDIDGDLLTVTGLKFGISPSGQLKINGTIQNLYVQQPFINNTYIMFDLKNLRTPNVDNNCQIFITNSLGLSSNEMNFTLKGKINITIPPTIAPTVTPTITPTPTNVPTSTPTETPLPTNNPSPCMNNCGGTNQGKCSKLGCVCISPYTGVDCSSKVVVDVVPVVNNTEPKVVIPYQQENSENKFTSLVSIYSLRELNFDKKVVNEYIFEKWNYHYYENDNHTYFTTLENKNDYLKNTNITVVIKMFKELTTLQFADQNITMQPSSVKYYISLSNYQFKSDLNTLDLVMYASIETDKTEETCSGNEFGDSSSQLSSQYLKIQVNDISLYGEFIKRAIVDTHIVGVSNKVLTTFEVKGIDIDSNPKDSSSQYISIQIPHFKTSVDLDPNFSVLLESSNLKNSECGKKQSSLSKSQLIGIVIGSVAGFVIIVIVVTSITYRKSTTLRININRAKQFKMKKLYSFK